MKVIGVYYDGVMLEQSFINKSAASYVENFS
jgi:hypothetical protein